MIKKSKQNNFALKMKIFHLSRQFLHRKNLFSNSTLSSFFSRGLSCSSLDKNQAPGNIKYLLILDLEATCDTVKIEQEIIEFPCLKINLETTQEENRFHRYVKPIINPNLPIFCTELTGILQEMVDNEKSFPDVLNLFEDWRLKEGLTSDNSLYLTSGDWDLGNMIPKQCALSKVQVPDHMMEWIDIKKLYANNFNTYSNNLADVMKAFNLEYEGRRHSGIDDCLNIYKIVKKMINLGVEFVVTSRLEYTKYGPKVHIIGSRKYVSGSAKKDEIKR